MPTLKPTTAAIRAVRKATAQREQARQQINAGRAAELAALPVQRAAIVGAVRAGCNRAEIADAAGVTQARISQIANGSA